MISNGGWGDGERKFRGQHKSPRGMGALHQMLADGKEHRARTGKSLMVPRYDIVPIPPHLRNNLAANSIHSFPAETAQSMFDFRADDVVGKIAPRPLLLIHAANDSVTPTEQSVELFKRAGQPAELHLFSEVDHFLFAEDNARVWGVMRDWLAKYFPATVDARRLRRDVALADACELGNASLASSASDTRSIAACRRASWRGSPVRAASDRPGLRRRRASRAR